MKLLVSVVDKAEALEAAKGGAHIVDVKNPEEGALGANFPWIIRQVRKSILSQVEVSATLGDLPYLPGTASLAALGAAASGANYVKAGLYGVKTVEEAVKLLTGVRKALEGLKPKVQTIAAGYADYETWGCLSPWKLPLAAYKAEVDGLMVDVKRKNLQNLFDHVHLGELKLFVQEAHTYGLKVALAGGLTAENLEALRDTSVDIVGVRRSVLSAAGRVDREKVSRMLEATSFPER
ncbi:(5-formylfuran-3-yl)methyl phosphate synthase [Candidatus Hecatella orcuttiae]|uniref:(5-formylfuran-3-yl)methyl phosphate synthase n=1 Tax=Candidatus Hecatella orcuttiae TaxID=1935119 RepID=UPI0028680B11|nr:(5-formylfuran-3-yl)methyl phosphate synthase [Candidatus Hecatella orcuttiae]